MDVEKQGATPPQSEDELQVKRLQPVDEVPESAPPVSVQVPPCEEVADESHEKVEPFTQPDCPH